MRFTAVITLLAAVAATSVTAYETNAQRFARGLPPNPPARRGASNTDAARHHHPSPKPHHKHHGDGDDHDDGHKGDDGHDSGYGTHETNAQRLARGLPPNPPVRRGASETESAEHHHPSPKPHHKHHGDGGDDDKGDDRHGTHVRRDASNTDSAKHHHPSGKPHHGDGGDDNDHKCKTGAVQCCNSVSYSSNPVVKTIAGLAKAKLPTDNIPIGLGCSAIGEHSCSAHTVCCENNSYSGIIAIGCIAIKA